MTNCRLTKRMMVFNLSQKLYFLNNIKNVKGIEKKIPVHKESTCNHLEWEKSQILTSKL